MEYSRIQKWNHLCNVDKSERGRWRKDSRQMISTQIRSDWCRGRNLVTEREHHRLIAHNWIDNLTVREKLTVYCEMGDVANGKKLFTKMCATCHTTEKDGKHRVGPNLHGIMGRTCGSECIRQSIKLIIISSRGTNFQGTSWGCLENVLKTSAYFSGHIPCGDVTLNTFCTVWVITNTYSDDKGRGDLIRFSYL